MELKKIIIIFFFINFLSHLNAEMTEPSKDILPYDVVKIQLDALKKKQSIRKRFRY